MSDDDLTTKAIPALYGLITNDAKINHNIQKSHVHNEIKYVNTFVFILKL